MAGNSGVALSGKALTLADPEAEWPAAVDALKLSARALKQARTKLKTAKSNVDNLKIEHDRAFNEFDQKRAYVAQLAQDIAKEPES